MGGVLREKQHVFQDFVSQLDHSTIVPGNLCRICHLAPMLHVANLISIGRVGLSDFNRQL